MSATKWIIILSHIPIFVVALYAGFIYRALNRELRFFAWFLFISGVLQLLSLILWFEGKNNLFVLHLYVPAGFICIGLFYREVLNSFLNPRILLVTILTFVVFSILNTAFFQWFNVFDSNALTVECILILILSLSTYNLFLNHAVTRKNTKMAASLNLINSGLFIYHSSTLLIFYFGEYITSNVNLELSRYTWVLHSAFSVIMYIYFWRGLWKQAAM